MRVLVCACCRRTIFGEQSKLNQEKKSTIGTREDNVGGGSIPGKWRSINRECTEDM